MEIGRDGVWLCVDCTIVAVNGDTSGIDTDERVLDVTAGLDRLGSHLVPDFDSDTEDGILSFSWRDCDSCHYGLGGERHRFATLQA